MQTEDKMLTIKEVAEFCRADERTVRRWIDSKELPAIKLPGKVLVNQSALMMWLQSRAK